MILNMAVKLSTGEIHPSGKYLAMAKSIEAPRS
jgi:hypothetical protein